MHYVTFEEDMEQVYWNVRRGEARREEAGAGERMPSLSQVAPVTVESTERECVQTLENIVMQQHD